MVLAEASPSNLPKDTVPTRVQLAPWTRENYVCTKAVWLRLRARHGTVAGTVVVQELPWEVAERNGHRGAASHIAINQEGEFSESGPNWARMYLPRAMISAGSSVVKLAEKSFATPVSLMAAHTLHSRSQG